MYKFQVTIDNTKVDGTSHTNFTYLFSEGMSSIPTSFWQHVKYSDGSDIRFFSADEQTEYKREVVSFDSTAKTVEAWVQVPTLSGTLDTYLWCYYGGATVVNSTAVWSDINAKAIYHLQANGNDSTGINNGSAQGAPVNVAGKIEKAYDFDGVSDYFDCGNDASVQLSTTGSLTAWVKTAASGHNIIFGKVHAQDGRNGYENTIYDGQHVFNLSSASAYQNVYGSTTALADGQWHYVAAIWDGINIQLYSDGVADGSAVSQTVIPVSNVYNLWLGRAYGRSDFYLDGMLDEARVFSGALSADWIATEYANQSDPATFSRGSEELATTYKFKITIDKTKVSGTNTNFPYLFKETVGGLPSGFWNHVVDASGLDIRFYDTDGITELKREVVSFDPVAKTVEAWVQVPSLGTAVNKEIWCKYGGTTVANSTVFWGDVGYKAVYHLQENGDDSTGVNNGSVQGAPVSSAGKIERAYDFDGGDDYFNAGNDVSIQLGTTGSLSAWVKLSASGHMSVIGKLNFLTDRNGYVLIAENGKVYLELGSATASASKTGSATINDNQWHFITAVWDGVDIQLYSDGVVDGSPASQSVTPVSDVYDLWIGSTYGRSDFFFDGLIDEARVNNTALSSDWIATEYANQNAPATFSTCSNEYQVGAEYKFKITVDKTKVLGINNSTVFNDVSGKLWTAMGAAKLTTSTYKFAPASGVFSGVLGTYITTPDHADFAMGTGDYTIDFWFKTTQTTQGFIYYQGDSDATPSTTAPFINVINNKLRFVPDYSLDPSYHLLESTGSVNDGAWHHAACMRYGNVFSLYVDGVFQTSATFSYTSIDSAHPVYIGQLSTVSLSFAGNLDEFRVSKGIARWTSAFTPPTSKYVSDSYTKVLLHFGDDLTNFPYLFSSDMTLPEGVWRHSSDMVSGTDIRFYDTDGTTALKRELVLYSRSIRKAEAWVQIPSLTSAVNKEIWCRYGGTPVSSDTSVWSDVNATAIYHMQDAANASTGGVNLTVNGATQVGTGKINKAYSFNGSSDYMTATKVVHSGQYSISVWAYLTGSAAFDYKMVTADATGYSFLFAFTETDPLTVYKGTGWGIARYAGSWQGTYSGDTYASQKDSWHRVVATYDGDKFRIYVDGVLKNTSASWTIPTCGSSLAVGEYSSQFWMSGTMDELGYYSDAKLPTWVATEYANQNDPATFSTASNEQRVSKESILIMWMPGI